MAKLQFFIFYFYVGLKFLLCNLMSLFLLTADLFERDGRLTTQLTY